MTDQLERTIRNLYCDQGPLERDVVVPILLELLERIQKLEESK